MKTRKRLIQTDKPKKKKPRIKPPVDKALYIGQWCRNNFPSYMVVPEGDRINLIGGGVAIRGPIDNIYEFIKNQEETKREANIRFSDLNEE